MEERNVTHSTFVIERTYPAAPERVFAAFSDPAKKRRWFAGSENRGVESFELDFRVGGREISRSSFKPGTPFAGKILTNQTTFQDIVPNRRIVFAYTMAMDDHRFSASLATIELVPTSDGTELIFTDQGAFFENSDGPQIREQGWRKLLDSLASEVDDATPQN